MSKSQGVSSLNAKQSYAGKKLFKKTTAADIILT